jgi:hypothetical protein
MSEKKKSLQLPSIVPSECFAAASEPILLIDDEGLWMLFVWRLLVEAGLGADEDLRGVRLWK